MSCKHYWETLNGRNGWARCFNCGDETPWQHILLEASETYQERIQELEAQLQESRAHHELSQDDVKNLHQQLSKAERLGARMASSLYNVRQPAFHINDHDREVMGELVKEWDNRNKQ